MIGCACDLAAGPGELGKEAAQQDCKKKIRGQRKVRHLNL